MPSASRAQPWRIKTQFAVQMACELCVDCVGNPPVAGVDDSSIGGADNFRRCHELHSLVGVASNQGCNATDLCWSLCQNRCHAGGKIRHTSCCWHATNCSRGHRMTSNEEVLVCCAGRREYPSEAGGGAVRFQVRGCICTVPVQATTPHRQHGRPLLQVQ